MPYHASDRPNRNLVRYETAFTEYASHGAPQIVHRDSCSRCG